MYVYVYIYSIYKGHDNTQTTGERKKICADSGEVCSVEKHIKSNKNKANGRE